MVGKRRQGGGSLGGLLASVRWKGVVSQWLADNDIWEVGGGRGGGGSGYGVFLAFYLGTQQIPNP